MQALLDLIKKILPNSIVKKIRPLGHGFLAFVAAARYGFPSRKMIVIGITGTAGKSTTIQLLAHILHMTGHKTGYSTTVGFFDGTTEHINSDSMSMAGRFRLQGYLKTMVQNNCTHAIIEATSEGLAQNRHVGIDFDGCVITNLAEAHLDSHGGFDNYKKAKAKLFQALASSKTKKLFPHKFIGVNLDDSYAEYYLKFAATNKFGVTMKRDRVLLPDEPQTIFLGDNFAANVEGIEFTIDGQKFTVPMPGKFNAYNAMIAIATASMLGIALAHAAQALEGFGGVSGRMERIPNDRTIGIYLDYGPEPIAMKNALESVAALPHKKIIHVFGSTGGHRDIIKRFEFGELSAQFADTIIITNDDVYDSDPEQIARDIRIGIDRVASDRKHVSKVKTILDRRAGIKQGLLLAEPGDIVMISGKGSEQFLSLPGNKTIAWNDKQVITELLQEIA